MGRMLHLDWGWFSRHNMRFTAGIGTFYVNCLGLDPYHAPSAGSYFQVTSVTNTDLLSPSIQYSNLKLGNMVYNNPVDQVLDKISLNCPIIALLSFEQLMEIGILPSDFTQYQVVNVPFKSYYFTDLVLNQAFNPVGTVNQDNLKEVIEAVRNSGPYKLEEVIEETNEDSEKTSKKKKK